MNELAELHQNPIFQILVKKIKDDFMTKRFNPNKETEEQVNRWVFESGREFERDRILNILGIKE